MISDIDRIIFRRIRTRRIDFIRGPFRVRLRAAYRGDTRAFVRKPQCDRVPNPPPRAGHDRGLIFKSHVSSATRAVFCRAANIPFFYSSGGNGFGGARPALAHLIV
jgi:hypothetical protein